jgi:hypothetical protein
MGLHEIKKLLYNNNKKMVFAEAMIRIGENHCQLYIRHGTDNQNIQGPQKTKVPKYQWPNEEMGKSTEQSFFKGRSPNG